MAQSVETPLDELNRRHRATMMVLAVVFVLTVVLMLLAYAEVFEVDLDRSPALEGSLRIAIVIFGLGAVVLRRTMFSTMRLKDIAALRGASALLETLQRTTVYVALLAAAIALMGFLISLITGMGTDMLWLGLIAIAVLIYAYPRRAAWQRMLRLTEPNGSNDAPNAKGTIA